MNDFEAINEKINLLEYVSKRFATQSIGSGKYRINPCPICGHNDCFTVFTKSNSFHCFSCNTGGDVFGFLMATERIESRYSALQKLAVECGYELNKKAKQEHESTVKMSALFNAAAEFYHNQLNEQATEYLLTCRKRNPEMLESQKYGFANGHELHKHLIDKGFPISLILNSGLVRENDGKLRDLFGKNLFIYPSTYRSQVSDFFCKDYLQKDKKKRRDYQIPKDNKLNNVLFYGQEAIFAKEFIICEGPEDRNTIVQYSDMPTVAILGQLSKSQVEYLEAHVQPEAIIYLAFDKDPAGKKYEKKIIETLTGMAIIKKLVWPTEDDIDAYLNQQFDPGHEIQYLIDTAEDAIISEINNLTYSGEMDPRALDKIIRQFAVHIAKEPGEITRLDYIEKMAEKLAAKKDGTPGAKQDKAKYIPAIKRAVNEQLGIKTAVGESEVAPDNGIYEKSNRYYYASEKGIQKVSTFVLRIIRFVQEDEEMYYEVELINDKGFHSHPFMLASKERVNYRSFREACGRQGSFYYLGDDNHLAEIWQKEEERVGELPITCYFKRYGYIRNQDMWLFDNCAIKSGQVYKADENGIIEIDGIEFRSKDVNVYSNDKPRIATEYKIDEKYIHDFITKYWTIWDHSEGESVNIYPQLGPPYKTFKAFLALGYVAAMAYRPEWLRHDHIFPNLFGYGPVRTGKSKAIKIIMQIMGWHNEGNMWGSSTVVGISYALESLSCLPLWMEEYENPNARNPQQEKKINLIRGAYNLSSPIKGNINRNIVSNEVNTSFILTGQDYFTDKACQTRTIELRKEKPTDAGTIAYYEIKEAADSGNLSAIFLWLLKNKTKDSAKEMLENYETAKKVIAERIKAQNKDLDERTLVNYAMMIASFTHFNYSKYDEAFIDWICIQMIGSREKQAEADILYQFFNDIDLLYNFEELQTVVCFEEDILYMHYSKIYKDWKIQSNRLLARENISEAILRDYMKHAPERYFIDNVRHEFKEMDQHGAYIGKRQKRGISIYYKRLPAELREIATGWKNE